MGWVNIEGGQNQPYCARFNLVTLSTTLLLVLDLPVNHPSVLRGAE
jgi:hypothetical protein